MTILPSVQHVESFSVTGFSVRTQNKDEFNEKTAKLPGLWQQFYTSELAGNAKVFGVYTNYASDANGFYTVLAGIESSRAKPELTTVTIQSGNYLVFQGTGPMPAIVIETWQIIWGFFETDTKYKRNFISDYEVYSSPNQVAIYIGIK